MQLYAQTYENKIIFVKNASKQQKYLCLECGGLLRVRSGEQRHAHFYHVAKPAHCVQSGKSATHLSLQLYIQEIIPECTLEKRMPSINRIADVVWEDKKIVFEIQCSFISKEELEKRNKDYQTLGYFVLWILHDQIFNKYSYPHNYLAAEKALLGRLFFRTNFNDTGEGLIYDQFDMCLFGLKTAILKPFPVQLDQITSLSPDIIASLEKTLPLFILSRITKHPYFFRGDLFDLIVHQGRSDLLVFLQEEEVKLKVALKKQKTSPFKKLMLLYKTLLNLILERSCRA